MTEREAIEYAMNLGTPFNMEFLQKFLEQTTDGG